jgi:hypothetical protein
VDFEKIKKDLEHIVKVLDDVPQEYRAKGFELLVHRSLSEQGVGSAATALGARGATRSREDQGASDHALSKEFKAFLSRTGLAESDVFTIVDVNHGAAELRQYPAARGKAQGQMQIALLCALRRGVNGQQLEVDASEVREECKASNYYDEANFASNFKKNSSLFSGPIKTGQPPRRLSLEGERQLAQVVRDLAAEFGPRA